MRKIVVMLVGLLSLPACGSGKTGDNTAVTRGNTVTTTAPPHYYSDRYQQRQRGVVCVVDRRHDQMLASPNDAVLKCCGRGAVPCYP